MATTQVTEQILDLLEALRGCVQECVVDIAGNYVGHGPPGQVYIDNEYGTSRGSDCEREGKRERIVGRQMPFAPWKVTRVV